MHRYLFLLLKSTFLAFKTKQLLQNIHNPIFLNNTSNILRWNTAFPDTYQSFISILLHSTFNFPPSDTKITHSCTTFSSKCGSRLLREKSSQLSFNCQHNSTQAPSPSLLSASRASSRNFRRNDFRKCSCPSCTGSRRIMSSHT